MANYQGLEVWQKARHLAGDIYQVTKQFPRDELFGLTQQMRRAAISVVCNIAEAHGRRTAADRLRFLLISRGSLLELETQTVIAGDLTFLEQADVQRTVGSLNEVTRLLNGLIRHYEKQHEGANAGSASRRNRSR